MRRKISKRERKLKRVRILIGIIFLIILVFKGRMVDAGSNDSVIEKNRVENIYAVANVRGEDHLYYLNMYTLNNIVSYCIELGVDITSEIYNSTYDFSVSNLSDSQIDYIRDVSYFGYGYTNHNDYRYYMATQGIIWEYLNGINVEWTNEMNVNGNRIDISSFEEDILNLVSDYDEGVNFREYEKDMVVKIGDSLTFEDINNNLKYYEVLECKNCSAMIDGDNIYIDFDTDYIGKTNLTLKRKSIYGYDNLLYYQTNSQKLISNGDIDDKIVFSFDVRGKMMNLQLKDTLDFKHNNQFDYSGIQFALYDSNKKLLNNSVKCDKYGRIFIENMAYGEYYVKQNIYNYAYILNNVFQKIKFDDDEIIYVDVVPVINEYKITKLYGEGDYLIREEGITFDIYNVDGTLYHSVVTDEDGVCSFKLPYGKYTVRQRNSSYGYSRVEDFDIDVNKKISNIISYTLVDEIIKTNLIISAKDEDGNLILDDTFKYKIKNNNGYLKINGVSEFESVDGVMVFPDKLGVGEYVIEVVNDGKSYKEKSSSINLVIDNSSNLILKDGEFYLEVNVVYDLVKGKIEVNTYKEIIKIKDDSYYYDYVKNNNVKLEMIANDDIIINNKVIYNKGEKISDITTDEDGSYILDNVYLGSYCLIDADSNSSCFEVVDDEKIKVTVKEELDKGSVSIHNISSSSEDIKGTVMELYDSNNKLIYVGSTNDMGIIELKDLSYGDYCFKEKSVKNSYLINNDKVCFSINNDNLVSLEIINKINNNKLINVPNTFSEGSNIKKIFVLLLIILGGYMYKIKISNSNN